MPCESMMSQNQDYSSEGGIPTIVKLNVGGTLPQVGKH